MTHRDAAKHGSRDNRGEPDSHFPRPGAPCWVPDDNVDRVIGGPGEDAVSVNGRDVLRGGGGPNVLRGHGGSDVLAGRGGVDELFGGAKPDRCTSPSSGALAHSC